MQVRERFVGRHAELDELRAAVDASVEGRGSLVLIAGEPGIGKTRLSAVTTEYARGAGCEVRWASCWDGAAAAYWPWTQLVRSQLDASGAPAPNRDIARLLGDEVETAEGDAELVRFALFDAIARFLRSSAAANPLVLVVDDLHWADVESLRLLEFFAQDVRDVPVVVIGTFRDVEVDPDTERGRALGGVVQKGTVIHLGGLAATEVAELLAEGSGALAETAFARAVHEQSGGNPLFVHELARLMRARDRPPTGHRVPEGVQAVIRRRVARLSQACHELLSVASVLGTEFAVGPLSRTSGVDADLTLRLIGESVASRLVAERDAVGRYAFSHALVREALYEALPLSKRVELHSRAGEVLEETGNLDEVAYHYVQAAPGGAVEKAIEFSVAAGRRAVEQLAYESSAMHFQRAIDALDLLPDDERRTELLLELGDAHLRSGDMPAARSAFEAAADLARRRGRVEDLARAALGFGAGLAGFEIQVHDAKQIDLLEEALTALPEADSPLRAWLAARLSVAVSLEDSIEQRRAISEQAVATARRAGDRGALAYALAAHCDAIAGPADRDARLRYSSEIIEIARARRDRPMELLGYRLRIVACLEAGDMRSASTDIEAYARVADLIRQPLYLWYVSLWRGMQTLVAGDVDRALDLADEAQSIGGRAHSTNARMLSAVLRAMAYFNSGRFEEARASMWALSNLIPEELGAYMHISDAWLFGRAGREAEARAAMIRLDPNLDWIRFDSEYLSTLSQLSEAVDAVGERDMAARIYPMLLPYRSFVGVEGIGAALHGSMELHLGLLARTMGDASTARKHFAAAEEANARLGAPLLVERARRELATVSDGAVEAPAPGGKSTSAFVNEGEFWTLSFEAATVRMKDAKGLHDLAKLVARPGKELAALDLVSDGVAGARSAGEDLHAPGHAGELLDDRARAAYKARLADLEEDIAEATELGDAARAEKARAERDALAHELASAYGLGGRPRKAGDPAERARTTVTRRIREAMARIEDVHPALGRHLRKAVRTGTFCSYDPETPVIWRT